MLTIKSLSHLVEPVNPRGVMTPTDVTVMDWKGVYLGHGGSVTVIATKLSALTNDYEVLNIGNYLSYNPTHLSNSKFVSAIMILGADIS